MANPSELCNKDKGMVGGILNHKRNNHDEITTKAKAHQSSTQKVKQRGIWKHPLGKKEFGKENGLHPVG